MNGFANIANFYSFGTFSQFFFSKPNTEPYSMTQDSTLDTPQGGLLDNFFYPLQWGWETQKMLETQGV